MPASSLVELLRQRATQSPDLPLYTFLKDGDGAQVRITAAELDRRARALASVLVEEGARGERVVLFFPPGLDYATGFMACLYAGAIAVPAYPPDPSRLEASLTRLAPILESSGARFALTTTQIKLLGKLWFRKIEALKRLEWISGDAVRSSRADRWSDPGLGPDDLAFLQYTSGSTGDPKGVMVTHGNLLANLALIEERVEVTPESRGMIWLPPYHDLGLIGGLLLPMYTGFPITLMSPVEFLRRPMRWLEAISRGGVTVSGGPGFAYDLCTRRATAEDKAKLDLSRWKVAFIGAEPIHPETMDRFTEAFAASGFRREAFYPTYGMAEATLIVTGDRPEENPPIATVRAADLERNCVEPARKGDPGSRSLVGCGRTMNGQRVLIVNPETAAPCATGAVGEVWIQGPSVAKGYWNRAEETGRVFGARLAGDASGASWLRSGDLGFLRDGELYVTGRLKDLIIVGGRNFYPQEIEWAAQASHPELRPGGTAAFSILPGEAPRSGMPATDGGERVVVIAEVRKGASPQSTQEIIDSIRRHVAREIGIRVGAVALIAAGGLPKTSSGKLQRRETRAKYIGATLHPIAEWQEGMGSAEVSAASAPEASEPEPKDARGPSATLPSAPAIHAAIELIARESAFPAAEIRPEYKLADDLGLDSIMMANLMADLEGKFPGASLPQFCAETTVGAVLEAVAGEGAGERADALGGSLPQAPRPEAGPETHRFELFPEVASLKERFQLFEEAETANPYLEAHDGPSRDTVVIGGKTLVNFSGYNYVGMSGDPRVNDAAKAAIDRFGTSASASRLASGEVPLHRELEHEIAALLGTEDAIVMVAGHATNVTTIGHLVGQGDLILHDSLAHDSIIQGALLSGAQRRPFPHNDWKALDWTLGKLRGHYRRVLIVVEGVYSMDGDFPDLPKFIEVKKKHKALLFVDEAHSIGVLGPKGNGITGHFGVDPRDVDVLMGTLSKAMASCGGYVAGSRALVEYLKYTAPGFVYSVGLPPSNAAAALESLRILRREPERLSQLKEASRLFLELARARGLDTGPSEGTPVIPVILGSSVKCLRLSHALAARGINAKPILYPAVAEDATRLRFFINSTHTPEQIRMTVDALAEEIAKLG